MATVAVKGLIMHGGGEFIGTRAYGERILKHRSCKQPEGVGCQFGASGAISGSSGGSKLTLNNNKINN